MGVKKIFQKLALTIHTPLVIPFLLSACTYLPAVGPNYHAVKMDLPAAYLNKPQVNACSTLPYWQRIGNPTLAALEEKALAQSLTLQQAEQRIKQARAQTGLTLAGFGPTVTAQGGYQGTRYGAYNNPVTPAEQTQDVHSLGLGATWEIDLFGGQRRAHEAANAMLAQQQAVAAGIRSSLMAEVARQYLTYVALTQRLALTNQQLTASSRIVNLAQKQNMVGLLDNLAFAQIRSHHAQIAMQKPLLEGAVSSTQYTLESLLAQKPGTLTSTLTTGALLPQAPSLTAIPLPSQLLSQRPDVIAADRAVAATTAQIGVATADLFPKFNLTGSYGVQAPSPAQFDSPQALTWSGGPTFSWTLFSTGKILSNISFSKARQKEAVLAYQQTVLNALADVESRLKAAETTAAAASSATAAAEALQKRESLVQTQYTKGLLNGMQVAAAQLESLQTQDLAVQANLQALITYINLYQSLGL